MEYRDFLEGKRIVAGESGFDAQGISTVVFPFQEALIKWAIKKGRAAIFADTGLGKTIMEVEIARIVSEHTEKPTLIVAPLSVARQTVQIANDLLNTEVHYTRNGNDLKLLNITNYEMIKHFDASVFDCVILDESSILKSLDGKTRRLLTLMFKDTLYKFALTATPAPNDIVEIGNHSEFLGILSSAEMRSAFFYNTGKTSDKWKMRSHGEDAFFEWMASWGMFICKPSDLGFDDTGYNLPELHITPSYVSTSYIPDGQLFHVGGGEGLQIQNKIRRLSVETRVNKTFDTVYEDRSGDKWLVWCTLNDEQKMLEDLFGDDAVSIRGTTSIEDRLDYELRWRTGDVRVLITKPKVFSHGMNWQHCNKQVFCGLTHSWEQFYQSIRRSYRFGQGKEVFITIVLDTSQESIYSNVMTKEVNAQNMRNKLIDKVKEYEMKELDLKEDTGVYTYGTGVERGESFTAYLGDSAEQMKLIESNSVDLSVFSPPFADLYTYTATAHDLGNCSTKGEFFEHFGYIIRELLRVTKPGRNAAVHVADIPAMMVRDGYIGMKDFPGDTIRAFEENGWIWYGRAFIEKNPQLQAIRTKAHALMFKQLNKDSSRSRPAIADQILVFKRPGTNAVHCNPVQNGEITNDLWIQWANPIWEIESHTDEEFQIGMYGHWHGISESDTLQYRNVKSDNDVKHVCPLQLETIERCVKLWSNPNETVLTPFGGIGSEAYTALKLKRKAILIELKPEYYKTAVQNLRRAEEISPQPSFDI